MSIQTEIDRIITAVSAAHEKVSEKGGTTAQPYLVGNLADAIDTIPVGAELPALTNPGKASDALSGKEFIDGSGNKVTGTIATKTASNLTASGATVTVPAGYYASQATKSVATATQATPSIEVSSAGLITAKATQTAGYVAAGTKSGTKQLTTQAAQTITPGTSNKTIASGRYLTGTQTIKGDANLVAGNIKSGVSIFGVAGSYSGSGSSGGSSGGLGTCTVTIKFTQGSMGSGPDPYGYIPIVDDSMNLNHLDLWTTPPTNEEESGSGSTRRFTFEKTIENFLNPSIISLYDINYYGGSVTSDGAVEFLGYDEATSLYNFKITGDCTIWFKYD